MKRSLLLLTTILLCSSCESMAQSRRESQHSTQSRGFDVEYRVLRVSDGDTISVANGSERLNVRFACGDSPEIKHGRQPGQPLGNEARDYLKSLIEQGGNRVKLNIVDIDRYGRKISAVYTTIQGREVFVQEEMIRMGLQYVYRDYLKNCPNPKAVLAAEEEAKSMRRGVWGISNLTLPWEYRRAQRNRD